ncbi:MAG: malectin domain-containing carbohydrate-binding protein [Planctomycetota bacterium]|nr:malectin domain-containing carbohydrate-binding protein [Planctomycetota bacterium]
MICWGPIAALEVDAGADQELTLFYNTATFQATVTGAAVPDSQLSWEWRLWSGPASGNVYPLSDASRGQTFVEEGGVYVIAVTVSDGTNVASDTVTLFVNDDFRSVPGRLEAEDANLGNGLGYLDLTSGNSGGAYRADDLDVAADAPASNGHAVVAIESSERLDLSTLSQSGFYDLTLRVRGSGVVRLEWDGRDLASTVDLGSGSSWRDVVVRNVESYGYVGTFRIVAELGGFELDYVDFVYLGSEPVEPGAVAAINCGGAAYLASDGTAFAADGSVTGGKTYGGGDAIAGTSDDPLYQSERYGDFAYAVAVPDGIYELELHLAEIYFTANGKRVFDLVAEGQVVVDDIDLHAVAGHDGAHVVTALVTVEDGVFELSANASVNNAKLSAFVLRATGGAAN